MNPIQNFVAAFFSAFAWLMTAILTVFFVVTGFFIFLPFFLLGLGGKRAWPHRVSGLWSRALIAMLPFWSLDVRGASHIRKGRNYIIVANHQSILDILVVLAGVPAHFKFIAKKELFAIPFLGWHMKLAGYISLLRGNSQSAKEAMVAAQSWLRNKVCILMFPEGTRSLDGEINRFKPGAFKLAQAEGVEVLPVIIDGTRDAIPKHSWVVRHFSRFQVSIEKPVRIKKDEDIERAVERVRNHMISRLYEIRKEK